MKLWRRIVASSRAKEEHVSLTTRTFNYRAVFVTTITLECGHKRVYRGDSAPSSRALCRECSA